MSASIAVGRVLRPWGRFGAVAVEPWTNDVGRFERLVTVQLAKPDGSQATAPLRVLASRIDGRGRPILRIEGIDSIDEAEAMRDARLLVPEAAAEKPRGEAYFNHDLVGLEVWTQAGARLGVVREIVETGATNVLAIEGSGQEVLIPAAAEFLVAVDLEARRVQVALPAGLLEINGHGRPDAV